MRRLVRELRLGLDWWLKSRLQWSAAVRIRPVGELDAWSEALPGDLRARLGDLRSRYDLSPWEAACSAEEVPLNLDHLDILDQHLGDLPSPSSALDVGCRSWWNLPGNHAFRPAAWTGVELDAHQRFVNGSTRAGVARAKAAHFEGSRFEAGCVTGLAGPYDLVLWLLPYVDRPAFDGDQLPRRYFTPEAMLDHTLSLVAPGGTLWITNYGEEEAEIQRRLLAQRPVTVLEVGPVQSPWLAPDLSRYAFRCSVDRAAGVE